MSILEDFYAQDQNPDGGDTVDLSSQTTGTSQTTKQPTTTTRTQITPDVSTSVTAPSVIDTDKSSTTSTQYKENTANTPMSQPEWENQTGARAVYARLGMQPPKPSVNADRKRKIMGYEAIGEALRNVVDATYGKQKAIIVPHKSYLSEFANEIAKDDANEALKFKEYYKALDAQGKALADNYMKYYTKASERAYDKVSTTTGNERTFNPEKNTVTTSTKGIEKTLQTGGGSSTTSSSNTNREAVKPIDYSGAGKKEVYSTIKLQDGREFPLTKENHRVALERSMAYGIREDYSDDTKNLIQMKLDKKPLTAEQEALLINGVADKNLDLVNDVARSLNIRGTQGSGYSVDEVVKAKRSSGAKTTPVAKQSTNPVVNNKITVNGKPTYKDKKSTQNSQTDAEYKAMQDANAKKEGALKKGYKKKQAEQTTKLDFSGVKTAKIRR